MSKTFCWPIRVYYEDTDAGGIVYYANYLKFFERARTEWLRALGFEQDNLMERSVGFVVKHVEMDNIRPARFNQQLNVIVSVKELKKASIEFEQILLDEDQTVLVKALIKVVCVNVKRMKPIAIPEDMLGELSRVI